MNQLSQFLLATAMLANNAMSFGDSKVSDKTRTRASERGRTGTAALYTGKHNKVEQKRVKPFNYGKTHEDLPIVNIRKTQRNDKCPCGSEKKFKKCCLK